MEQSHVLNRVVTFTEIPGSPKLAAGTKITFKIAAGGGFDVIAITPQGQTYEFKSNYVDRLVKSPWVHAVDPSAAASTPVASTPTENPYTIGDVASVEKGIENSTPARIDVTGSSEIEDKKPEVPKAPEPEVVGEPADEVVGEPADEVKVSEPEVVTPEGGIGSDTLAPLDVTGSSSEDKKAPKAPKKAKNN